MAQTLWFVVDFTNSGVSFCRSPLRTARRIITGNGPKRSIAVANGLPSKTLVPCWEWLAPKLLSKNGNVKDQWRCCWNGPFCGVSDMLNFQVVGICWEGQRTQVLDVTHFTSPDGATSLVEVNSHNRSLFGSDPTMWMFVDFQDWDWDHLNWFSNLPNCLLRRFRVRGRPRPTLITAPARELGMKWGHLLTDFTCWKWGTMEACW